MAWPVRKPQGRKSAAAVVVYIFMQITVASQEPATSRALSKRGSKNQKTMSKVKGKKHEETTKTKLPDPLRGVRKTKKKRARRVKFNVVNKPLPAFFLFMVQHRPRLQKRVPHWTQVMIVEKLAEMWHKQPEKRKEMYKDHAVWLRKKTGIRA